MVASINKDFGAAYTWVYFRGCSAGCGRVCVCNWYILQHQFYLWEVATGILELGMSKSCFSLLESREGNYLPEDTVLALCVVQWWEWGWRGCNTVTVTVVRAADDACNAWWLEHTAYHKDLVLARALFIYMMGYEREGIPWCLEEETCTQVPLSSNPAQKLMCSCVENILCNELCADCVPVLPHVGGPRQNEDTAA